MSFASASGVIGTSRVGPAGSSSPPSTNWSNAISPGCTRTDQRRSSNSRRASVHRSRPLSVRPLPSAARASTGARSSSHARIALPPATTTALTVLGRRNSGAASPSDRTTTVVSPRRTVACHAASPGSPSSSMVSAASTSSDTPSGRRIRRGEGSSLTPSRLSAAASAEPPSAPSDALNRTFRSSATDAGASRSRPLPAASSTSIRRVVGNRTLASALPNAAGSLPVAINTRASPAVTSTDSRSPPPSRTTRGACISSSQSRPKTSVTSPAATKAPTAPTTRPCQPDQTRAFIPYLSSARS